MQLPTFPFKPTTIEAKLQQYEDAIAAGWDAKVIRESFEYRLLTKAQRFMEGRHCPVCDHQTDRHHSKQDQCTFYTCTCGWEGAITDELRKSGFPWDETCIEAVRPYVIRGPNDDTQEV